MPDNASTITARDVARRYHSAGWPVRLKLWLRALVLEPATIAVHVPRAGRVLDLACGDGTLSIFLALDSAERTVHGVDLDAGRVATAQRAGAGVPGLMFATGDLRDAGGEPGDAIVLIDALHYFRGAEQLEILRACRARLGRAGVLVLRDAVREPGPAFWWNQFHERVMVGLAFTATRDRTLCFLSRAALEGHLRAAGFDVVHVARAARWMPYTDTVFVARCRALP